MEKLTLLPANHIREDKATAMFKRLCLAFFLLAFLSGKIMSQTNLQTGSAVFSLPVFNWQDDKSRLNSVVSLNYNSGSGLKVNDIASNEGQGWSLYAGGVVTRMQVGEPDDQKGYNGVTGTDQDITKYPSGVLYAPVAAYKGCPNTLTRYPIYGGKNVIYTQHPTIAEDRQMDYFSFQFNGKTGLFVVDLTNGGSGWSLGDTKMKITFQTDLTMATNTSTGIRTTISSFSIQDVDGLIYKFGLSAAHRGLSKVLQTQFCDPNATAIQAQPTFGNNNVYHQAGFANTQYVNPWIIGSWYLSEIDDPLTGRKIQFSYNTRTIQSIAGADITDNQASKDYIIISHKTSVTSTPEISSVTYPDGHSVIFNYAANQRIDYAGQYALASIDVKYLDNTGLVPVNRFISEFQLGTSYFIKNRLGTPVSDYEKSVARLCLKYVKKIGVDLKEDAPPYTFDYYTGSSGAADDFVPPPFFYAKDIYGYYNGSNNVPDDNNGAIPLNTTVNKLGFHALKGLCFLNSSVSSGKAMITPNPKPGYAQNGLLRQIIYPTGGTLTYQYAQNVSSTGSLIGGVSVSQTSTTDGGYSNGCANPMITQYNYVMNGVGSASSVWGTETPVNSMAMSSHYAPEERKFHFSWSCGACCYWKYQYPGILSQYQAVSLSDFQNFMNAIAPVLTIIGVISDIMDVVTVVGGSTGVGAIVALVVDVICIVVGIVFSCTGSNANDTNSLVFYNADLNAASPLPLQFKRVEIVQGTGGVGKTVQLFTSSDDYPVWIPSNPTFSAKQRFASWAYGLPKLITVYDVNGKIVKQTQNVYDFGNVKQLLKPYNCSVNAANMTNVSSSLVSCKCVVLHTASQKNTDWSKVSATAGDGGYDDANSYNINSVSNSLSVDIYGMYTGRVLLDTTYQRIYKLNDQSQFVQTFTAYDYNSNYNYEVNQIATLQSDGDIGYETIKYSSDYTGGALSSLTQNNIVSTPVEKTTAILKAGTSSRLFLSEQVTEFAQLSNGDIKPSRQLEQRFSQPVAALSTYLGAGNAGNPAYKQVQTYSYTTTGILAGMQDEGGHVITNIYDYNDKYVAASIINADPAADKCAYTSFETPSLGGWSLTGAASYSTSYISGNRSLVIGSGNTLSAPLNTAKPYLLSFWATAALTISGGSLIKSTPVVNGFTYYEYAIGQGTSSVSISGAASVDELRIYPQTARMRTVSYDPIIGKTTECDENSRATYYSYDNLGRLQFIKDERGNILKMYEYNNVALSKLNGCPGTFGNHVVSETFTKNNCSAGYQGGDVTFTIPANKYTSTVSQADADAQAENDILSNGQAYANTNGTCTLIYHNAAQSQSFQTQTCAAGSIGGQVAYAVPAGRYSSLVSQADADQQALDELNANGQSYANDPAHAVCITDNTPEWEGVDGAATKCELTGTTNTGHQLMQMTDVNPNSPTYNTTQWKDIGINTTACPVSGSPNRIINGNFEYGPTGFGTDYAFKSTTPETDGDYMIAANPYTFNAGFCSISNHTSGGSNMLIVDGSENINDKFWYQLVNVTPNTTYTFSYWCVSLDSYTAPVLQTTINGVSVNVKTISTTCNWQQVTVTWNSGSSATAFIQLNSQANAAIGNDFAIDDISFK